MEYDLYTIFLFKQKTAYDVRISDWSSDVCSSDLPRIQIQQHDRTECAGADRREGHEKPENDARNDGQRRLPGLERDGLVGAPLATDAMEHRAQHRSRRGEHKHKAEHFHDQRSEERHAGQEGFRMYRSRG